MEISDFVKKMEKTAVVCVTNPITLFTAEFAGIYLGISGVQSGDILKAGVGAGVAVAGWLGCLYFVRKDQRQTEKDLAVEYALTSTESYTQS